MEKFEKILENCNGDL